MEKVLKVGDKVKIKKWDSLLYGRKGTVVERRAISSPSFPLYRVKLSEKCNGWELCDLSSNEMDLLE